MRKHQLGFGIIELVWLVFVLSIFVAFFMMLKIRNEVLHKSKEMADITKEYASVYAKYINLMEDNALYVMTDSTHCEPVNAFTNGAQYAIISQSNFINVRFGKAIDVDSNNKRICQPLDNSVLWDNSLKGLNRYKQIPCVAMKMLSSNKIKAFLYWANTSPNSKNLNIDILRHAVLNMDNNGSFIDSNGKLVGSLTHSLSLNDPMFTHSNSSCKGSLGSNSIIYDISGYLDSNLAGPSHKISRIKDFNTDPNDPNNKNTSKFNIYVNGSINLDSEINLTQQNGQVTTQAGLVAKSIVTLESVNSYSACDASELGTIKNQQDDFLRKYPSLKIGNEMCTHSPAVCNAYNQGDNCYIPTVTNQVKYSDLEHSGKFGSTITCPPELPILDSATAWQDGADNKPTIEYKQINSGGYYINIGANAVADTDLTHACNKWQFTYASSCLKDWYRRTFICNTGTEYELSNNCGSLSRADKTITCDGKATKLAIRDWKCIEKNSTTAFIETAVCSNKVTINESPN